MDGRTGRTRCNCLLEELQIARMWWAALRMKACMLPPPTPPLCMPMLRTPLERALRMLRSGCCMRTERCTLLLRTLPLGMPILRISLERTLRMLRCQWMDGRTAGWMDGRTGRTRCKDGSDPVQLLARETANHTDVVGCMHGRRREERPALHACTDLHSVTAR